jgi:adenine/guanine phosphoribosyltransferase-like PRPP-binding protein
VIAVLAHGGTWGLLVELSAALGIVVLGLAVWIGNRRDPTSDDSDK